MRPASNLNLSSVIFASAAEAATSSSATGGKITTSDTAPAVMTLRMDGSNEDIGTFEYNADGIAVKKGSQTKISLVVQGNDGTNDWYYSKRITSDIETVSADEIKTKSGASSIDLTSDKCKIWLEVPAYDNSTISYAVTNTDDMAKAGTLHTHEYNNGEEKATPSEYIKSSATDHWWECTKELCPNREASKINTEGEPGRDEHNWITSQEQADAEDYKETFEEYIKDQADFLVNGTGNVNYETNAEDETICDKITTYYVYCSGCERIDTSNTFEYVEHGLHDMSDWYRNAESHWKQCKHFPSCTHTEEAVSHIFDENGVCKTCGFDKSHQHDLEKIDEVAATCTTAGNIEYYRCKTENCGLLFEDATCMVPIANINDTYVPATGHKAASYKYDETKHWKECENVNDGVTCGVVFDEAAHSYSGSKCTVCGYSKSGGNSGTTYDDGSTKNSDRSSSGSSSSSGGSSGGGSGSTGTATGTIAGTTTGTTAVNYPTDSKGNAIGNWTQDAKGWTYGFNNGQSAKGTSTTDASGNAQEKYLWVKINDKMFAFGSDGYLKTGWLQDSTGWYYCDIEKGMLHGWYYSNEDGYWYYFDTTSGALKTGWQQISGKQYFFAAEPAQRTYTFDAASSKWVYNNKLKLRPYGSLYMNTTTPDNRKVDANGAAY